MKKLDCKHDLSKEQFGTVELKALVLLQIVEEFATRAQVNDEAVVVRRHEGIVQLDQDRILKPLQDLPLSVHLVELDLIQLDSVLFDKFHGIKHAGGALADHVHSGKATGAEHLDEVKVSERRHAFGCAFLLNLFF